MHLHNNGISNNTSPSIQQKKGNSSGEKIALPPHEHSSNSQDSVVISPEAHSLKQLESIVKNTPDVDTAKVEKIRLSIADGSYTIDSEKIAEKMLSLDNGISTLEK